MRDFVCDGSKITDKTYQRLIGVLYALFFSLLVLKTNIIDSLVNFMKVKQEQQLRKTDGHKRSRISGIAKLDDANQAGTRNGSRCTLILTEGDSAKSLAVSGLSVVGRDHFGVFPLRGKLLNVRDANLKQVSENQELNHIKQILGLQHAKEYTSTDSLRYGSLMIMTDQVLPFDCKCIKCRTVSRATPHYCSFSAPIRIMTDHTLRG